MIGGRDDAKELQTLKNFGVTHILNLTNVVPNMFPESFIYSNLALTGMLSHRVS